MTDNPPRETLDVRWTPKNWTTRDVKMIGDHCSFRGAS